MPNFLTASFATFVLTVSLTLASLVFCLLKTASATAASALADAF